MDLLQGPIKHLSAEIRASIVKMWIDAPPRVVERYKVRRTAGGDFEYSHRWEFITLQVD
jgi:hypothetical protein